MANDAIQDKLKTDPSSVDPKNWYDSSRAKEVMDAYNSGGGSALPADLFLSQSLVPAGTGALRDFSYIAPDLPLFKAENCVGCMDCVNQCPDTAILGKAVTQEALDQELAKLDDGEQKKFLREQFVETTKYHGAFEKKREKDPSLPPGAQFGIFIDPTKCKGCAECVDVCGDHDALFMIKKTRQNLPSFFAAFDLYKALPATSEVHVNAKLPVDVMLKPGSLLYVGGAGSCMGCGEATALRMMMGFTHEKVGTNFGLVCATGCNTVYGSTYPYNPFMVPWTNSLFENAPADAMGVRSFWDGEGHAERVLWCIGGDGAMLDIGFQSLSRMLASGMNIKVMVLDTQVYSNTGGQTSTATFIGQEAKMSMHGKVWEGKLERRKEIGQIAMMHPNTFVAQTIASNANHFYRSITGALEFPGPAVVNVYTTCQPEHGVADDAAYRQAKLAVESRAFPVFIYDPTAGERFKDRLSLMGNPSMTRDWHVKKNKDGGQERIDFLTFAKSEGRFRKHFDKKGSPTEVILRSMRERLENWRQLQDLAGVSNADWDAEREEKKKAAKAAG